MHNYCITNARKIWLKIYEKLCKVCLHDFTHLEILEATCRTNAAPLTYSHFSIESVGL